MGAVWTSAPVNVRGGPIEAKQVVECGTLGVEFLSIEAGLADVGAYGRIQCDGHIVLNPATGVKSPETLVLIPECVAIYVAHVPKRLASVHRDRLIGRHKPKDGH